MELRRIKLMPDDVIQYPLWEDGVKLLDEDELRGDLGLSEALLEDIESWAAEDVFPPTEFCRISHRRKGEELIRRLQQEAGVGYAFRFHRPPRSRLVVERLRKVLVYPFARKCPDGDAG